MPTLTIHDRTATGRPVGTFTLDVPGRVTVRELIGTRVREEVAHHILHATSPFRGLVTPTAQETTLNGAKPTTPRRVDWESQAKVALDAFERNGFFVHIDRRQHPDAT